MDFYTKLSGHYDTIFPAEAEIVSFLKETFADARHLLDIACGTGTYTIEMARVGFTVTGIDLDGSMIEGAKEKDNAGRARFFTGDMVDGISELGTTFDGAYCIGNSLPHLDSLEQVALALEAWRGVLGPGGLLMVQLVNFNRFALDGETELPTIRNGGCTFRRRYLPGGTGKVRFDTTLTIDGDANEYRDSLELLAIKKETLSSMLTNAGFGEQEYFGGYAGDGYDPKESFLTICVASVR